MTRFLLSQARLPAYAIFAGIFFLCGTFLTVPAYAKTMYVKKSGTKLMEGDSARAKVLGTLKEGTPVEVLRHSGRYYEVAIPGGTKGWLFQFYLTPEAPAHAPSGGNVLEALGGREQVSARESSSATSIRGLTPVSEQYAKNKGISPASVDAVKQMEALSIPREEREKFLAEGNLGEYGQ
ncbi:MAG: hypothetical protein COV67_10745 [Nitrospinae bacterium CG11_big_fil_rev_8_21_14_0_20_56_8]|nr:MAG: hypothetical protein COV67_10745 [Nitrospinae bacterium CG11_big_fil_rev_8_21_14_0_20_56_8]